MLNSQRLVLAGATASLLGGLGLAACGPSSAAVFLEFGSQAVEAQSTRLCVTGLAGALFGAGAAAACWGITLTPRDRRPGRLCLALLAAAGLSMSVSGAVVFLGTRDAARAGETLAYSRLRPEPEDIAPAASGAQKMFAGYALLVVSQAVLLLGAFRLPGEQLALRPSRRFRSALAIAASLFALSVAACLFAAGCDRSEFSVVAASSVHPSPAEVAMCLLHLLSRVQTASIALILLGVAQAALSLARGIGVRANLAEPC